MPTMRLPSRRTILIVAAVALVILGACAVGFGPLVRAKVQAEATRRHAHVTVGSVRPGLFAVHLKGVHATPDDIEGVTLDADDVEVDLSVGLKPKAVTVRGGTVHLAGNIGELRDRFARLRARDASSGGATESRTHTAIRLEGARLDWSDQGNEVHATGFGASRSDEGLHLEAQDVTAQVEGNGLTMHGLAVDVDAAQTLKTVRADRCALTVLRAAEEPEAPARTPAAQPDAGPLFRLPDLKALRAKVDGVAVRANALFPESATVVLDAVEVVVRTPNKPEGDLALGRGPLSVSRTGGRITATFSSEKKEGVTPMLFRVALPADAKSDLGLHLEGGPVPATLMGLRNGPMGITDVEKTTLAGKGDLTLAPAGEGVTFDGNVAVKGLGLTQPRLSKETLHGLDVSVMGRGVLTEGSALRLDDGEVSVGALHFRMHGTARSDATRVAADLSFDVPTASCGAILTSVPSALVPTLAGATMRGTFGARGHLGFDSTHIDDLALDYDIYDDCHMDKVPEALDRRRFTHAFRHRIYHPDGTVGEELTGPGSDNWTPLGQISPFMQVAVLTTEDGGFRHHHGFSHTAIKRALVNNLKAKRFVQGASTISMQLAKNLFLTREKTLSRKLEEIILTDYLEQTFDKDEMMELYLNIIEFGPDVYGIGKAAYYYFGRRAEELNVAECMFLSSVLPSPVKLSHLKDRGELSPGWQANVAKLIRIAQKTGKITEREQAEGAGQAVVFHKPGAPRPPARPPARGSRFEGENDDWQPVDAPQPF